MTYGQELILVGVARLNDGHGEHKRVLDVFTGKSNIRRGTVSLNGAPVFAQWNLADCRVHVPGLFDVLVFWSRTAWVLSLLMAGVILFHVGSRVDFQDTAFFDLKSNAEPGRVVPVGRVLASQTPQLQWRKLVLRVRRRAAIP